MPMFRKVNPNPQGKNVGDCTVRAIAIATDQSWEKVYIDLCLQGYMMADMPSSNDVWTAYLAERGWQYVYRTLVRSAIRWQILQKITTGERTLSELVATLSASTRGRSTTRGIPVIKFPCSMDALKVLNPKLYSRTIERLTAVE